MRAIQVRIHFALIKRAKYIKIPPKCSKSGQNSHNPNIYIAGKVAIKNSQKCTTVKKIANKNKNIKVAKVAKVATIFNRSLYFGKFHSRA